MRTKHMVRQVAGLESANPRRISGGYAPVSDVRVTLDDGSMFTVRSEEAPQIGETVRVSYATHWEADPELPFPADGSMTSHARHRREDPAEIVDRAHAAVLDAREMTRP